MSEEPCVEIAAQKRLHRIGGETLQREMIDLYLEHAPKWLALMRGDDFEEAERAAHSLKSSAGNMGARAMQALAAQAEQAARQKDSAAVKALAAELVKAFAPVKASLEEQRKGLRA